MSKQVFPGLNGGMQISSGLAKRDLFAAMALQGFCSMPGIWEKPKTFGMMTPQQQNEAVVKLQTTVAEGCVQIADILIKALAEEPNDRPV